MKENNLNRVIGWSGLLLTSFIEYQRTRRVPAQKSWG